MQKKFEVVNVTSKVLGILGKYGLASTEKKLSKRIEAEYAEVTPGKFEIATLP